MNWSAVEQEAADLLSRYIQFDTTNPPGNEALAIEFLASTLRQRDFTPQIIESSPGRANLIVRLKGRPEATAPPCLLYSHADVVPADSAHWSVPPFSGQIKDGFVWGRGTLDNKGLGIVFLQAVTLLKQHAPPLNRDIILLIAADEEMSSRYGVAWLLDHHPDLIKAEYVWDEGGMGLKQAGDLLYYISVAEKQSLTITLRAQGNPGHASLPRTDNPQDRLIRALYHIQHWKQPVRLTETVVKMLQTLAPKQSFPQSFLFAHADKSLLGSLLHPRLKKDNLFTALVRNTVNLTRLSGGQANNVIPAQVEAKLDVRLLPDEDPEAFLAALRSIINDAKVSIEVESLPDPQSPTPVNTRFYRALTEIVQALGPPGQITPYLTPGATDSRFFRAAGMKAYGFMPMLLDNQELNRIHGIDERVHWLICAGVFRWSMRLCKNCNARLRLCFKYTLLTRCPNFLK